MNSKRKDKNCLPDTPVTLSETIMNHMTPYGAAGLYPGAGRTPCNLTKLSKHK